MNPKQAENAGAAISKGTRLSPTQVATASATGLDAKASHSAVFSNAPSHPNPNPTGAEMMRRSEKIKYRVLTILEDVPQTRGDDMLLYIHVLRRFYWRIVRISLKDGFSMTCHDFKSFFMLPSFETCRRRRQEWQEKEKHRIARGEITSSEILPTERTIHKRIRNEMAHKHVFGKGQLAISDYALGVYDG